MPNEIRLFVAPQTVALVRISGIWRKRARAAAWRPVPIVPGQPPWVASVAALSELLQQAKVRQARASVVLSNQLVRYVVVPADRNLGTHAEQVAYARARLAQIHGESARDWDVRAGREPAGHARLAAAIDPGLIEALRGALAAKGIRMADCRPALTATFDAIRKRIARDAWIVAAEPGRVLVARLRAGEWTSIRVRPLEGKTLELSGVIAQERILQPDAEGECDVYVSAAPGLRMETNGIRSHVFGTTPRTGLAPELHVHAALAMAGMG